MSEELFKKYVASAKMTVEQGRHITSSDEDAFLWADAELSRLRAENATYKESYETQLILKEGISEANEALRKENATLRAEKEGVEAQLCEMRTLLFQASAGWPEGNIYERNASEITPCPHASIAERCEKILRSCLVEIIPLKNGGWEIYADFGENSNEHIRTDGNTSLWDALASIKPPC